MIMSNRRFLRPLEERYSFDVTLDDIIKFKEGECPLNTVKNTEWAVHNFEAWRTARNKTSVPLIYYHRLTHEGVM